MRHPVFVIGLLAGSALPQAAMTDHDRLERAGGPGYRMLLRQIEVAEDRARFGEYFDHGALRVDRYKEHLDLPAGYWVYVHPYWYIWRDRLPVTGNRSYGPEQLTDPPDVTVAGDNTRAWCPKLMDTASEWVLAEFKEPIKAVKVLVHESFTPGSVERVTLFTLDGREIDAWRAEAAKPIKEKIRMQHIPLPLGFSVTRIKLYLRPRRARGWNEIDAVGVEDAKGKQHWAHAAAVSTTYAPAAPNVPADAPLVGPSPDAQPKPAPKAVTKGAPELPAWPPPQNGLAGGIVWPVIGEPKISDQNTDTRAPADRKVIERIEALEKRVEEMGQKLDRILELLQKRGRQAR